MQKLLTFFNKIIGIFQLLTFEITLTDDVVSFEHPGPGLSGLCWKNKPILQQIYMDTNDGEMIL